MPVKTKPLFLSGAFIIAMLFVGLLRLAGTQDSVLTPLAGVATPLYVAVTIAAIVLFSRTGLDFNRLGFGLGFRRSHLALAAAGLAALQLSAVTLGPLLEDAIGQGRDLSRFADVEGSLRTLLLTLALSWTFAAFGEELAFRIVMLRGLAIALGQNRAAWIVAVLAQAMVFGLVHIYQGPAGAVSATISGLIFGIVTVAARGSIWPAALAHGTNNTIGLIAIYNA